VTQSDPRGMNTCAYYRGVDTCEFGCYGPDGPRCQELGPPGPDDLAEWRRLELSYSEDAERLAAND
jgi:hypothetical protein